MYIQAMWEITNRNGVVIMGQARIVTFLLFFPNWANNLLNRMDFSMQND